MWYPENKRILNTQLTKFVGRKRGKKINGIIVPHAAYLYSGAIAGSAFAYLKGKKYKKAVILGPSHYVHLYEAATSNRKKWSTPLGNIDLFNKDFPTADIRREHSITNQIPFLQKLGFEEIMPLMVGQITNEKAEEIAKQLAKLKNTVLIFSTDLSHFLPHEVATQKDKHSIKLIEDLNFQNFKQIDACGIYPLLILFHLCKLKKTKPKLIQYKNSGDITKDHSAVVGYASFYF
ncbi:AmmeMemoRadiSam system protein B [Candidatus Pacearchaeota archaeon]|nr:AmmeMemoRadiSam system protein B [Candidatus Pacearchaeota archaeon]